MNYYFIPVALIVALLLIFILSLVLRKPIRGFGYVFLILFLATWVGQLWIAPFGPMAMGIAWLPLIFMGLVFVLLILALSKVKPGSSKRSNEEEDAPLIVAGFFFWLLIFILVLALVFGLNKNPELIA